MTFGQPLWFWALALLLLFPILFFWNEKQRTRLVRRMVAARLAPRLAGSVSIGRRRFRFAVILASLACVIVSLAQPRWGFTWQERKFKGRDVLIAIDVSRSMLANDLQPSRLARAKLAAEDLIDQLHGDRVGLIAFAGTAFLQAPLTADHGAAVAALHELDPDIIPRGGTNIAEALRSAEEAFGKGESDNRALVLFTDGEELEENAVSVAKDLHGSVRIFTVGLGSPEGTIIAIPRDDGQTEYVKDEKGEIVKSRLDEPRLREIAQAADGFYLHLNSGPAEMQQIVRDGLQSMTEHDLDSQLARRPIERYQWPLSAGLVLLCGSLLIGERKRIPGFRRAAAVVAFLFAAFPASSSAKNGGVEAYEQQDYKGALDSFDKQLQKSPDSDVLQFDLGSAAYKTGDFDRALKGFSTATTSADSGLREKAEYNLGNTLVQRGLAQKEKKTEIEALKDALQHYDAALKVQPADADAVYNRDAVQKLLAELQKEEQEQKQEKKDQQNKDQKKDDKQQDQKQQKDSQSKDQKDQSKNGQSQQPQDGQSKEHEQGSGSGKSQQSKDQQSGSKEQQQSGKEDEQKQPGQSPQKQDGQENKPQTSEGAGQNDSQQKADGKEGKDGSAGADSAQVTPPVGQAEQPRKLSGELKDAGQAPKESDQPAPEQEAAAEAEAAAAGKMTEQQARILLDSLKGEDDRVRLLNPNSRKSAPRSYRDW